MNITTLVQPENQLGPLIEKLLDSQESLTRIVFVSAFTALKTVLRLRDRIGSMADRGASIRLVLGIDLGGTSREVLEELLTWKCETCIFHNPIVRATFHPKVYFFLSEKSATLFVGSNNLTDGGLYTNYEAATRYDFFLPNDQGELNKILSSLQPLFDPKGATVQNLNSELIATLSARGILPSEQDARRSRQQQRAANQERQAEQVPKNPFSAVNTPRAPLLLHDLRPVTPPDTQSANENHESSQYYSNEERPVGPLVWKKKLPKTDALKVKDGSHHVGGVRLTQAHFENPPGHKIDQTTYFRELFDDYDWERESGGHRNQEHAFVPMRIFIRGVDHGIRYFEISHKPSGEAGQANYTTILRWGRNFNSTIENANITNTVLSLYETPNAATGFLIDIVDP